MIRTATSLMCVGNISMNVCIAAAARKYKNMYSIPASIQSFMADISILKWNTTYPMYMYMYLWYYLCGDGDY